MGQGAGAEGADGEDRRQKTEDMTDTEEPQDGTGSVGGAGSVDNVPQAVQKLVGPFIKRGQELNHLQPLIAYYCYLYAAQLILESQLHLQDAQVAEYIEILLNTIEENRSIIESTSESLAGILKDKQKSYKLVMGFSLKIFNKCVTEIDGHVVNRGTVQSFLAFLNFIEVLKLWPELYEVDRETIQGQIKYAKFHTNRILKALKVGDDPNDYVTAQDEKELSELMNEEGANQGVDQGIFDTKEDSPNSFSLPEPPSDIPGDLNMPTAPVLIKGQKNSLGLPSAPESENVESPEQFPQSSPSPPSPPSAPVIPPKPVMKSTNITTTTTPVTAPVRESKVLSKEEVEQIWTKNDVITAAQRKAKFAISALNYEDIETAITELQGALKLLKGE